MNVPGPSRPTLRRPRLPPTLPDVSEHWTVFGQVMENEGLSPRSPMSAAWMTPRTPKSAKWPHLRPSHGYDSLMQRLSEDVSPPRPQPVPEVEHESDSDVSEPASEPPQNPAKWTQWRPSDIPLLYRNIFKCAVAYLIATLFTFVPWLSSFIHDSTNSPVPLTHMGHLIAIV